MRCPSLSDLPTPPAGKTGWPWTGSTPLPNASVMPDGTPWPRISIVTPSYNQGQFIEETIRSVLLQGYPDLEYIIIDGASTDDSVAVIKKYEPWLSYWISEKDGGQAHAINKGLEHCTGEIFQFLNSDDFLTESALIAVACQIRDNDCLAGGVIDLDEEGRQTVLLSRNLTAFNYITRSPNFLYHQPGVWVRTPHVRQLGGFNASLRYKFDWDLIIRYVERWPRIAYIDRNLAFFRLHSNSKTVSEGEGFWEEELIARELLVHKLISAKARAALTRIIQKRHWRLRINELVEHPPAPIRTALWKLFMETLQNPLHRLDRYTLGAAKRIIKNN
jgi:glycosyltransferase involved in cell wall biosynthesis